MTRGRHRREDSWKRRLVFRLTDQVSWSAGFFSFNLAATLVLATAEYALLALATSIVFMGVAVARSWSLGARIVVATKVSLKVTQAISLKSMAGSSLLVGAIVAAAVGLSGAGHLPLMVLQIVILAFGLVLADMPRQGLIYLSRYNQALFVSLAYAGLSFVALACSFFLALTPIWLWMVSGYLCALLGWFFQWRLPPATAALPKRMALSHAWRLTAESVYTSVASQLGLLLLYWFTDPNATAGYRLSYALIYAPAFMLLQGIAPLLAVQLANEISSLGRAKLRTWFLGPGLAIISALLCGLLGYAAGRSPFVPETISRVVPFLVPVGLALVGSQVLDFLLSGVRYFVTEHVMHRVRLFTVTIDVVVQALAISLGGVDGLLLSLVILAVIKLAAAGAISVSIVGGRFSHRSE